MESWFNSPAKVIDAAYRIKAEKYQLTLTKPSGALGVLEQVAIDFSAYQERLFPIINNVSIAIMVGDHGIAESGVSAFPQIVTGEMVKNFASGGAAISVLAKHMQAQLTVYNVGTVNELDAIIGVEDCRIAAGTRNFLYQPAMTLEQCLQALAVGRRAAQKAQHSDADVFIGGEMGIANTSAAACLAAKLLNKNAKILVGPGTGLDESGVDSKEKIVNQALAKHDVTEPLEVLCCFGGFEIAALVGSYIACAQLAVPVIIDGYIATAAALIAVRLNPGIKPWLIASHESAEPAHQLMLQALGLKPLVQLGMRLGEGSGAAVVVPLLQAACRLQSEMASFSDAGVSGKAD